MLTCLYLFPSHSGLIYQLAFLGDGHALFHLYISWIKLIFKDIMGDTA